MKFIDCATVNQAVINACVKSFFSEAKYLSFFEKGIANVATKNPNMTTQNELIAELLSTEWLRGDHIVAGWMDAMGARSTKAQMVVGISYFLRSKSTQHA